MSGDCEGPEVLRRRIKEQNRLIDLLSHRNNQLTNTTKQKQQQDEQQQRTPRSSRAAQQLQLQGKQDQLQLLQRRFSVLSHNHDEIIKIKDEYKTRNRTLEADNARLQHENTQLFSAELSRQQGRVEALQVQLDDWQQRQADTAERLTAAEQQSAALSSQLQQLRDSSAQTQAELAVRCQTAEQRHQRQQERRAQLSASCAELAEQLTCQEEAGRRERLSAERRCSQLTELAADRGRQVKERGDQVTQLRVSLATLQETTATLRRDAAQLRAEALRHAEVERLTQQLTALRAEYDAYRRHVSYQLEQERRLNQRLRHFQVPRAGGDSPSAPKVDTHQDSPTGNDSDGHGLAA